MYRFNFTRNIVVESFSFLVAYRVKLQHEIEKHEKEINFFTSPMRDIVIESLEEKKKELEKLEDLIENYRNEF